MCYNALDATDRGLQACKCGFQVSQCLKLLMRAMRFRWLTLPDGVNRDFGTWNGLQVCLFCYHKIKETGNGQCPGCREEYGDKPIRFDVSKEA